MAFARLAGMDRRLAPAGTLVAALFAATLLRSALAEDSPWTLYPMDGRPPLTVQPSGEDGIRLQGEGAIALAVRPAAEWVAPDTCLSWRWRVDAGPPATDLAQMGTNDRAIALWVGFRAEAERMTLAQRYAYGMIRFLSPVSDPPGFILAYTWGGAAPTLRWEPMPQHFFGQLARQRVVRAAVEQHGVWVTETVRLADDFRAAFGVPATQVMQLAVFADGDSTGSRTDVAIEAIRLHKCAPVVVPPVPPANGATPPRR